VVLEKKNGEGTSLFVKVGVADGRIMPPTAGRHQPPQSRHL
jgi:hypothetical protein